MAGTRSTRNPMVKITHTLLLLSGCSASRLSMGVPRSPSTSLRARAAPVVLHADRTPFFGDLPLPPAIAGALAATNVTTPTPIQAASALTIRRGAHVLLHSETGSGKTLAYLLPLLAQLHVSRPAQLLEHIVRPKCLALEQHLAT